MKKVNSNQVVMGVISAALLVCSLPLTWLSITNAELSINAPTMNFEGSPFGDSQFGSQPMSVPMPSFGGLTLSVTGLNGSFTVLGMSIPIGLLVFLGGTGAVLATLNAARVTTIPPVVPLLMFGAVGLFMVVGLMALTTGNASLGAGYAMAAVGVGLGAVLAGSQLASKPGEETA